MKLVSPGGVVVDASETHATVLLKDGWRPADEPARPQPEKAPRRRTAKAAPKEV